MRSTLLALCLSIAACGVTEPGRARTDTISDDAFIEIVVELQKAKERATSAEAFDSMKREILARRNLNDDDVIRYAHVRGRDIERMIELFDTLTARFTGGAEVD